QSWTGMEMFVGSRVPADDPRLNRVYSHFRTNLTDICRLGAAGGFPVVVCTIPVNLQDSWPVGSAHAAGLSAEQTRAWEQRYKAGVALEAEKKHAEAIHEYQQAEQLDAGYAEVAFRLGRCCAATGDAAAARRHFERARDLDVIRFRTDSTNNGIIR